MFMMRSCPRNPRCADKSFLAMPRARSDVDRTTQFVQLVAHFKHEQDEVSEFNINTKHLPAVFGLGVAETIPSCRCRAFCKHLNLPAMRNGVSYRAGEIEHRRPIGPRPKVSF